MKRITAPLDKETALSLKSGDRVLLSGYIYTSRDAGHKRMCEALKNGEELPIDLTDSVIYYVGPTPAKKGEIIGSAGPTTSGRMDAYAPTLMEKGLCGMIGKGERNVDVISAMQKNGCVYFGAIGGAGALLSQCVKENTPIAYEDLGAEALCRLLVEDMPLTVIIDANGNNLYKTGREKYLNKQQ